MCWSERKPLDFRRLSRVPTVKVKSEGRINSPWAMVDIMTLAANAFVRKGTNFATTLRQWQVKGYEEFKQEHSKQFTRKRKEREREIRTCSHFIACHPTRCVWPIA